MSTRHDTEAQEFAEHPVEVFKRNIYISPFWEDDPDTLIDIMGPDHVLEFLRLPGAARAA